MYERVSIDDVEAHELDGIEPTLLPVGMELRPDETRPSVWDYEEGESNNLHYQEEQEELYVPLAGRFEVEIDDETIELGTGDVAVVEPAARRRLTALTDARLLVVGAPPVTDDGVVVESESQT